MDIDESTERARHRMRTAQEVIDWCRRLRRGPTLDPWARSAAALELHQMHALHARERGDEATAALAQERYDLVLEWRFRDRRLS